MAYYQQNMLSIKSRGILAHILAEITILSQTVQTFRQALADVPYFDCISLFRFIDKQQKGYLRQKDFQRIIGTSHRKLLTYAFSWFDRLKVGEISRLQFAAVILPRQSVELRELLLGRMENSQIGDMNWETLTIQFSLFRKLVLDIINRQMKIIQLRYQLITKPDYSIKGSLLAMDVNNQEWICGEDVFNFMKNYGVDLSLSQVQNMLQMVNSSLNGKVTEQQLRWIIEGLQGKDRTYLQKIKQSNKKQCMKNNNFQSSFSELRRTNQNMFLRISNNNRHQSQFKSLVQKMKLIEQKQKHIEKSLCQQGNRLVKDTQKYYKKALKQIQFKGDTLDEDRTKGLQSTIQEILNRQFEGLLSKADKIQSQTDRLLQNQNNIVAFENYGKQNFSFLASKDYPIRARKSINKNKRDIHLINPSSVFRNRKSYLQISNYQDLYPTFNLTKNEQIKKHIQSSDVYLKQAKEVRDSLRKERQAQRQMNQQSIFRSENTVIPVRSKNNRYCVRHVQVLEKYIKESMDKQIEVKINETSKQQCQCENNNVDMALQIQPNQIRIQDIKRSKISSKGQQAAQFDTN